MSIHAIIVDQSASIISALCPVLESVPGVSVVATAGNGYEAIRKIRQHRPDLVLLDLLLPGMTGFEVAREMRRESLTSPIIMMSVLASPGLRQECLKHGAVELVSKTDMFHSIGDLIERLYAYSRRSLPLIPDESCHPFQTKPATDFTAKLPPW